MTEIFATRSDWLIHCYDLPPNGVIRIHPRDDLTWQMVAKTMGAQGLLKRRPGYRIIEHGTVIFIQRDAAIPDSQS